MNIERTNTILYCHKWRETVAFYRNVFDFPISYQNDWFVEFQLTDDAYLSMADESRCQYSKRRRARASRLSWQIANLSAMHAILLKQNITVSAIRLKWRASLFYLHDPEGHRIELWQRIED